jgi:antitoxin HicB
MGLSRRPAPRQTTIWREREGDRRSWKMSKKHVGSSIEDLLKAEGIFEEAQSQAIKEVIAWQLAEAMKTRNISKNKMATLLKTSRTQVDRLLDPRNDVTLSSLQRAAAIVGRRVSIELV